MRRLLAALLLCLVATYAVADTRPHDLRSFAYDAGLPDTVELIHVESEDPNGFYWQGGPICQWWQCVDMPETVGVFAPASWPREWVLGVLFHEIGHYRQHAEGRPYDEWDADLASIRELCRLGLNGPAINAAMLTDLWERGGVVVDSATHGNLFSRIENARSRDCRGELRTSEAQS